MHGKKHYATMLHMTKAGIAAVMFMFCSLAAAQQPAPNSVVVIVQDQSGAVIPRAGIRVIEQTTKKQFDTIAGETGQAELYLPSGIYTFRVQARGFLTWAQTDFKPASKVRLPVILKASSLIECGPCVDPGPVLMSEDDIHYNIPMVTAEIPLVPVPLLNLHAKRLRLRPHA